MICEQTIATYIRISMVFFFCLLNFVVFIIATIAYRIDFELLPFVTSHETLFLASRILTSNGNVICGKYYFIITAWPLWSSQHTNDDKQNSMFDVLVHNKKQKIQRKIFSFSEKKKKMSQLHQYHLRMVAFNHWSTKPIWR